MGSSASVEARPEDQSPVKKTFIEALIDCLKEKRLVGPAADQIRALNANYEDFQKSPEPTVPLEVEFDGSQDGEWLEAATLLIAFDKNLEILRHKLVPSRMKESLFWKKYFKHIYSYTANKLFSVSSESGNGEFVEEKRVAIEAVLKASRVCNAVFRNLVKEDTVAKKDRSPVTVADFAAQAVVISEILKQFPVDPVVGEEDASLLRENAEMAQTVQKLANSVYEEAEQMTVEHVMRVIDYGVYQGGNKGRHWALDPIDGTLGFLRGEQYAVCLALINNGKVVLGVLGCPNLRLNANDETSPIGCLLVAVKGQGAFIRSMEDGGIEEPIHVNEIAEARLANFVESVEASHSNHDDAAIIAQKLGITAPSVRMDSQAKYASVARGDASIYLRLPTRINYEERIWDHAAGYLIIEEAGGKVTDTNNRPLDFSLGRSLRSNLGVVATNGKIHDEVVAAVRSVLYPEEFRYTITIIGRDRPSLEEIQSSLKGIKGVDNRCISVANLIPVPAQPAEPTESAPTST